MQNKVYHYSGIGDLDPRFLPIYVTEKNVRIARLMLMDALVDVAASSLINDSTDPDEWPTYMAAAQFSSMLNAYVGGDESWLYKLKLVWPGLSRKVILRQEKAINEFKYNPSYSDEFERLRGSEIMAALSILMDWLHGRFYSVEDYSRSKISRNADTPDGPNHGDGVEDRVDGVDAPTTESDYVESSETEAAKLPEHIAVMKREWLTSMLKRFESGPTPDDPNLSERGLAVLDLSKMLVRMSYSDSMLSKYLYWICAKNIAWFCHNKLSITSFATQDKQQRDAVLPFEDCLIHGHMNPMAYLILADETTRRLATRILSIEKDARMEAFVSIMKSPGAETNTNSPTVNEVYERAQPAAKLLGSFPGLMDLFLKGVPHEWLIPGLSGDDLANFGILRTMECGIPGLYRVLGTIMKQPDIYSVTEYLTTDWFSELPQ